jgi:hypothetical protein
MAIEKKVKVEWNYLHGKVRSCIKVKQHLD